MKAVRFTILVGMTFLLLMLAACLGTDVQTDYSGSGDSDEVTDGDDNGDCEGEKGSDGDESTSEGSTYRPPLLTDPDILSAVFGPEMQSVNINFGDYFEGWYGEDRVYVPYTFDALPGASVTISLKTENSTTSPVLALYGPRTANGLWGRAVTWLESDEIGGNADILDYQLRLEGQYLILVSSIGREGKGRFYIGMGCRNQCREAACPDNVCQGFCKEGYRPDGNGCTSCECRAPVDSECNSDSDCPDGTVCGADGTCVASPYSCQSDLDCLELQRCELGLCVYGGENEADGDDVGVGCGCPEYYDPVCGSDGVNYSNECIAACYGVEGFSYGPCVQEGSIPCSFDNDCPANMMCNDYVCQSTTDCGCPEYYDPVCGSDGLTYNNYCELECVGVEQAYYGVCDGEWHDGECQPICTRDPSSSAEIWQDPCTGYSVPTGQTSCSACDALCLNLDTEAEGWYSSCDSTLIFAADCLPPCGCNDSWEPVCGSEGVTYSNPCEASCFGADVLYEGECDPQLSGCTSSDDCPSGYVCVTENDCTEAACPGYCTAIPVEQECREDMECPEGMYCKFDCTDPENEESCSGWCVYDNTGSNPCVITGCNFELCSDRMQQSYCSWQNEYACLDFASCEVGVDGLCGWLPAEGHAECLEALASASACNFDGDCASGTYCDFASLVCLDSQCICPDVSDPVCDSDGNVHVNACLAVCAGATPQNYGDCR